MNKQTDVRGAVSPETARILRPKNIEEHLVDTLAMGLLLDSLDPAMTTYQKLSGRAYCMLAESTHALDVGNSSISSILPKARILKESKKLPDLKKPLFDFFKEYVNSVFREEFKLHGDRKNPQDFKLVYLCQPGRRELEKYLAISIADWRYQRRFPGELLPMEHVNNPEYMTVFGASSNQQKSQDKLREF